MIPANIEKGDNDSHIVQIGWTKCGKWSGGYCDNIPADGALHFFVVCNDSDGGHGCVADSWFGLPISGRRYRFRIQYNQTGTQQWDYSVQDLVTGVIKSHSVTANWHQGSAAWWGGETHEKGSTMGPTDIPNNAINMYWMQYYRSSVGYWQVVTDIDLYDDLFRAGASPTYYHQYIYDHNYTHDAVNLYTSASP